MISSKKTVIAGIILVSVLLVATVVMILLPEESIYGSSVGTFTYSDSHSISVSGDDYYSDYSGTSVSKISLKGNTAEVSGKNVTIDGTAIEIIGGGTYVITGELSDGGITVDSKDDVEVRLVLAGASITCSSSPAIRVEQAEKVIISTVKGTENFLSDTELNTDVQAAVFSRDNLTVNGEGTLTVNGNCRDGIKVNDSLKITEGKLIINAEDDGINVNDSILCLKADITVNSGGDAIKCENESDDLGFIALEKTTLSVISMGDGICASTAIYANSVNADITCGDTENSTQDTVSTKALKAGANLVLTDSDITADSLDDAFHSDGSITINGGTFTLSSGDDAVHAEADLILNPDKLDITKSKEAVEGAYITVSGGEISMVSSDDAINAVGYTGKGMGFGFGTDAPAKTEQNDIYLTVNGGSIHIETSGDGIDSNGSAVINGGTVTVYGPENSGNGSIDVGDGGYVLIMNGGRLLAAGSSGMAEAPYGGSKQNSLCFYLDEYYSSGSVIAILDEDSNVIMSGTSAKKFNLICVSTPDISIGKSYTLTIDGSAVSTVEANSVTSTSGNERKGFRQ